MAGDLNANLRSWCENENIAEGTELSSSNPGEAVMNSTVGTTRGEAFALVSLVTSLLETWSFEIFFSKCQSLLVSWILFIFQLSAQNQCGRCRPKKRNEEKNQILVTYLNIDELLSDVDPKEDLRVVFALKFLRETLVNFLQNTVEILWLEFHYLKNMM